MSTTINGYHLFTVNEYSRLCKNMDIGRYIKSDPFTVGGYDWDILFFPNGYKDLTDEGRHISVCLNLLSDCTNVEALFDITLLDQSGNGKHCSHGNGRGIKFHLTKGMFWGYMNFMKKQKLESSDYLKNDSLTFCCMVGVVQSCIRPKAFTIIPPRPEIEKDLKCLLDSEIGSDIVFRVKEVTFKAHKAILAARSPMFKAQFYGLVGNPALDEVELLDIEPSVFKAMLMFIYSDTLPDSEELSSSMSMCTSTNMIQDLLAAADRFGLDWLKQFCEAKLCEEVNADTVAATLSLADQHLCSQLKAICLKFAAENLRAVMQTEGYKYLKQTCPLLMLELLETVASVAVDERPAEGGGGVAATQMPAAAESGEPYVRRLRNGKLLRFA